MVKIERLETEIVCDMKVKPSGVWFDDVYKKRNTEGLCCNRGVLCGGGCGKDICSEHTHIFVLKRIGELNTNKQVRICEECTTNNPITLKDIEKRLRLSDGNKEHAQN